MAMVDFAKGRRVVLGANGFIGQHLMAACPTFVGITRQDVDLSEETAGKRLAGLLRDGDSLFFLSAITPDRGRDAEMFMKNCRMAFALASVIERVNLARLIYVSSDAVFSENLPSITEETPACPNTLYGTMHLAREQICGSAAARRGTPFLVVRPCALYGPGDTHQSYGPNRFLDSARREKVIRLFGEGADLRPHLHIRDFVSILVGLDEKKAEGVFHAIPSASVTFREIADLICRRIPEVKIEKLPIASPPTTKRYCANKILSFLPQIKFTDLATGLFL
jgi:nucleoside-diphosphate-sugar epimerase